MSPFPYPVPGPPDWAIDWPGIEGGQDWLRAMRDCAQDPAFHAEGDVWTHTRMVCEELCKLPGWRELDSPWRGALFTAALLHDVAKPSCSRREPDGRITSQNHAVRGGNLARRILWRAGMDLPLRERIVALVRWHHVLHHLLEGEGSQRRAIRTSVTAPCDRLALLAEADVRGRRSDDSSRLLENLALTTEYLEELGCLSEPWPFPSDHSRVLYFRKTNQHPSYDAYDDTWGRVTVMSGLPGAGKSTWLAQHASELPVLSLDELRKELGVSPTGNQGRIVQEAQERSREYLRRREEFAFDATNLSLQLRGPLVQRILDYKARVRIVYVEVGEEALFSRNRQRESGMPASVIERLLGRWQIPDVSEAHEVVMEKGE